eukprot:Pgem_evm2s7004
MKFCGGLRLSVAVAQCYAKNKNSPFPLTFTESVFHWNVHHTNPSTGNSFPNRGKAGCLLVPMKLADCKTPALKDVCDKKLPTKEEIYNYYFFNGDIKDWKATPRNSIGSLTQLSREMSNGKFELNGAVSNWVESNWTADEIEDERYQDSLKDAYNSLSLDDRKKVDSDADGEIDCILYVTFPDSGGYMRGGVDHTFTDDTGKTVKGSEYSAYGISDEPANKPDKLTRIEYWNSLKKIVFGDINGQFHELGHVLGLTDLYTVNNDNDFALGRYALMMFTGWNNELPHYTPITKIMWGWANITKTINEEGKYTIKQSVGSNEIFKISKGFKNGEYLLIENRGGKGSESARQQGLYIWHVDENLKKSTVEERELYPTNDNVHDPANYLHPTRLSFIQADGQFKLERRGWSKQKVTMSDSEIFSPGTELRNVLGKTNKDFYYSGVSVSDIKINVNKTITFKVNFDMFPVSNENETCETTCLRNSMTCNEDFMKKLNKYYSADICKNMIREKDSGANFNFNVYDRTDLPCGYKINTNSNANADVSGSGFCGTKASNYKSLCSCSKLKSKGIKRVTYFIDNWALNEKCTGKSSPSQYNVIVKRDLTRVQAYNFCLKSDKCLGFAVDNGADKYGVNNYEFYEEKTAQSNAPVPLDCDKVDPNYMLFVNVEKQKARNLLPYWVKNEKCTGLSNVNDYLLNFSKIMSLTKAHLLCKESDKCVGFSYDVTGKHYQIYELKNTTVINGPAPITCNNPISKFKLFAKPYVTVTEIQLQESLPGADQKLCSGTPDPSKFETYSFQPQLTRYGAYEKCRKDNDCVGYASLKAKIGHQYYGYTAWNFYKAKTGSAGISKNISQPHQPQPYPHPNTTTTTTPNPTSTPTTTTTATNLNSNHNHYRNHNRNHKET